MCTAQYAVCKVGSQGVMIVLIPSLKGWDGSLGVMGAVLKVNGMGLIGVYG